MTVTTALLVEHSEALSALVDLFEAEWGGWYNAQGASARADLSERARRHGLPLGLVALVGGTVAGTAALTASSGGLVTERSPWLGGLVVHPDYRRRGVARALLQRGVEEARRMGHARLYALTAEAGPLFEAAGWSRLEMVRLGSEPHMVFVTTS